MPHSLPLNYFAERAYVKSDPATGLLASRQGNRLIAIPDLLFRSIHQSLREEAGEATPLALYTFGSWWGAAFYDRMVRELEAYYQTPIAQMNALEFLVTMRELWATHGLGNLCLDFSHRQRGLILVTTSHSILQEGTDLGLKPGQQPSFHLEAGFLGAWFSRWVGKELRACATDWHHPNMPGSIVEPVESGETLPEADLEPIPFTQFLVGLKDTIEPLEQQVRQGARTPALLALLA